MLKELYLLWLRLAAPQDLHYINGADTLPPPLPPEQERAALDALNGGSRRHGTCSSHIICGWSCTLPRSLKRPPRASRT